MKLWILSFAIVTNFCTNLISENQTIKIIKSNLKNTSKRNKIKFSNDIGRLCEFIAKIIVVKKYPHTHYDIKTNIAYEDLDHRPLGELDIVVFNRTSKNAEVVIEVKCRKNHEKALLHANQQLKRFKKMLQPSHEPSSLIISKGTTIFQPDLFKNARTQVMMPKRCGTCHARAHEFDVTLGDIESLQESLTHSFSNSL